MSFELELKKRQEEFSRVEAGLIKEISILRAENKYDSKIKTYLFLGIHNF